MKNIEKVAKMLLEILDNSETDFEKIAVQNLISQLTGNPAILDENNQYFNGKIYRRSEKYFTNGKTSIHRDVWEFYHSAIPEGYHIHHKDFNPANNNLENLQLLTKSEHSKLHAKIGYGERVCAYCGKIFIARSMPQKFCSRKCLNRSKLPKFQPQEKVCAECGKIFYPDKGHNTSQKFCSDECRINFHNEKKKEKRIQAQTWQKEQRTCLICGKKYFPVNSFQKFCSHECHELFFRQKRQVQRNCIICGEPFFCEKIVQLKLVRRNAEENFAHFATQIKKSTANSNYLSTFCIKKHLLMAKNHRAFWKFCAVQASDFVRHQKKFVAEFRAACNFQTLRKNKAV